MPIALLLQEAVLAFRFGAKQLTPWVHLVVEEELLIDRARSAFLVRWFGTHLPLQGSYLKIVIENLKDLRERYLAASQSAQPELSGPNLTEPFAGAVGLVAGMAISPTGIVLLAVAMARKLKSWLATLAAILLAILALPFFGIATGLVLSLGIPAGLLGGLYLGSKEENIGAVVELLGSGARLLNASRQFLEQLMGPREKVANPMLKRILELLDRLAGLAPHLLGFIAFVVTRLGPLLLPLALQVKAFQALIGSVFETLGVIVNDLIENLKKLIDPQYSIWRLFGVVIDAVSTLFSALVDILSEFFDHATDALIGIFSAIIGESVKVRPGLAGLIDIFKIVVLGKHSTGFMGLLERSIDTLDEAYNNNPVTRDINAAKTAFGIAGSVLSSGKKSRSTFPTLELPSAAEVEKDLGGKPILGFGDIAALGKLEHKLLQTELGSPPRLSDEAQRQLEKARHPASVFSLEEKALEASLGGRKPQKALVDQLAAQQQLRNALTEVVGRILPPELRRYMSVLLGQFGMVDEKIYGISKSAKPEDYPVRDLPDNQQLFPVVRRLIVRSRGGNQLELQDFENRVKKALELQIYPAPA